MKLTHVISLSSRYMPICCLVLHATLHAWVLVTQYTAVNLLSHIPQHQFTQVVAGTFRIQF